MKMLMACVAMSSVALYTGLGSAAAADPPVQVIDRVAARSCGKAGSSVLSPKSPGRATAAELRTMGINPKSPAYQKSLDGKIKWRKSASCRQGEMPNRKGMFGDRSPSNASSSSVLDSTSYNWAGVQDSATDHSFFGTVWHVPDARPNPSGGRTDLVIWPGMGGGTNMSTDQLIQAGTLQTCVNGSCDNLDSRVMWYELYPYEPMQYINNLYFDEGDQISADLDFGQVGNMVAGFTLCVYQNNEPDGECVRITQVSPGRPGNQHENIIERPSPSSGGYRDLTRFSAYESDDPPAPVWMRQVNESNNGTIIDMTNSSGALLADAEPEYPGSEFLLVQWKNYR